MPPIFPIEEQMYEVRWESQRKPLWDPHGSGITEDLCLPPWNSQR